MKEEISIGKSSWFHNLYYYTRRYITICRMRTTHCLIPQHFHKIGILSTNCEFGELGDLNHVIFNYNKRPIQWLYSITN